jgi:hypothetical protein
LIPKQSIRLEAEEALATYSDNRQRQIITVHRRHLEGQCVERAVQAKVACIHPAAKTKLSTNQLVDTCKYDYNMIRNKHKPTIDQNASIVVLMTDHQVPKLDETFPIRSNYSFAVETWMMVQSDLHYGNPQSSVDYCVAVWRAGQGRTTHPRACYDDE